MDQSNEQPPPTRPTQKGLSIPPQIPLGVDELLSIHFGKVFQEYVLDNPVYHLMDAAHWLGWQCDRALFLPFGLNLDYHYSRVIDRLSYNLLFYWDFQSRHDRSQHFLHYLFESPLFCELYGILSDLGVTDLDRNTFRNKFKHVWFDPYTVEGLLARGPRSCAFQHIFIGERRDDGLVYGLHHWVTYYQRESLAVLKLLNIHKKHEKFHLAALQFQLLGRQKPYGTIFFGAPIDFELCLFHCAFLLGRDIHLTIFGQQIDVRCHSVCYDPHELATAYFVL